MLFSVKQQQKIQLDVECFVFGRRGGGLFEGRNHVVSIFESLASPIILVIFFAYWVLELML
jgi:hypothetical protein